MSKEFEEWWHNEYCKQSDLYHLYNENKLEDTDLAKIYEAGHKSGRKAGMIDAAEIVNGFSYTVNALPAIRKAIDDLDEE